MEETMAATPKARHASPPSPLAFPVRLPPQSRTGSMPNFAFPTPANVSLVPAPMNAAMQMNASFLRPTVRTRKESMSDSLAGIAAWVEKAPLPSLPDSAWTIIGRAWFFVAGATMGILIALALVACAGSKRPAARQVNAITSDGTARALVIQRPTTAPERGIGALAENDFDEVAPPAPVPARRSVAVRRHGAAARASTSKNLLNAGL